jgi:hypothetical protein
VFSGRERQAAFPVLREIDEKFETHVMSGVSAETESAPKESRRNRLEKIVSQQVKELYRQRGKLLED